MLVMSDNDEASITVSPSHGQVCFFKRYSQACHRTQSPPVFFGYLYGSPGIELYFQLLPSSGSASRLGLTIPFSC